LNAENPQSASLTAPLNKGAKKKERIDNYEK